MNSTLPGAATDAGIPSGAETSAGSGWLRLYRTFLGARAVLGLALTAAQASSFVLGSLAAMTALLLCVVYTANTLLQLSLTRPERKVPARRLRGRRWWTHVGMDIALFTGLAASNGAASLPVAAMYVLPVMMSSVLGTRRAGLAAAAMATLGLLGASAWGSLVTSDWGTSITQSGLAGIGYFTIAILGAELASRLAREQAAARGSLAVAQQQAALNQLVIDEMQEGVLVVDRNLVVRAANPAGCSLLGERSPIHPPPFSMAGPLAWAGLRAAIYGAWSGECPQGQDVVLEFLHGPMRVLRMRWRRMAGRDADGADDLLVVLLEDRATLLARARQEKLAAMGRMSAGIAHEIRNPLAAISQANALLSEDLSVDGAHQRLTGLVASNVKRLQRIVDEVMLLAAPAEAQPVGLDATVLADEVAQDWLRTQPGAPLRAQLPSGPTPVSFEPDHLRRVMVNLLDNAWRHAQGVADPWISLELSSDDPPKLWVRNPSPPLAPEVERHLFEPFFSTRSRGSGLGLYICRELCERYGARIDYQAGTHQGQSCVTFTVTLQKAPTSP